MDWGKFKNIAIIIFVIINIVLCVLIADKKNKSYVIQDAQITRLQTIYAKENAALYTNVSKNFFPTSMLKVSINNVDDTEVCQNFWGSMNNYKSYIDNEKIIYQKEGLGQVEIYKNGLIKYKREINKAGIEETNKEKARELADNYIKKLKFLRGKYEYTQSSIQNDEYILEYNTSYKEYIIFFDYIKIHFKNGEITEVDISNFDINGYANEQREIASADEVLVNLLYGTKAQYYSNSQEMHVMDIKLGYYIDATNLTDDINIKVEPYYRVLVNEKDVYYINAYTNKILRSE